MYFLFSSPFLSHYIYIYISLSLSFSCPISLYVYMCTRILIISAFQPPHSPRPWSWFSNSPTFPPPPRGWEHGTRNTRHIYIYINLYIISLESLLRFLNSPRTATAAGPPWQKLPGTWLGPERGPAWWTKYTGGLVHLLALILPDFLW